jgi:hypothetical protein
MAVSAEGVGDDPEALGLLRLLLAPVEGDLTGRAEARILDGLGDRGRCAAVHVGIRVVRAGRVRRASSGAGDRGCDRDPRHELEQMVLAEHVFFLLLSGSRCCDLVDQ